MPETVDCTPLDGYVQVGRVAAKCTVDQHWTAVHIEHAAAIRNDHTESHVMVETAVNERGITFIIEKPTSLFSPVA
jgi:hypothetical protein